MSCLYFKELTQIIKKKQKVILLIIPKKKKKSLTLSCSKKTICISKSNNCLQSFTTENKLKCHEKVYKIKDFGEIALPAQKAKILILINI